MQKLDQLHTFEGKAVFATEDPGLVLVEYRDTATAYGGLKRGRITGKGVINNRMTNYLMQLLERNGEATCFMGEINERESLMKRVSMIPVEVIVRNVVAGSLSERLGLGEGNRLRCPIVELWYKNNDLEETMINETHVSAMGWTDLDTIAEMKRRALHVSEILRDFLKPRRVELIDMKVEFGYTADGRLLVTDELDPDTCRFWDSDTHERLDKDRFRNDIGGAEEAYQEIWNRVLMEPTVHEGGH